MLEPLCSAGIRECERRMSPLPNVRSSESQISMSKPRDSCPRFSAPHSIDTVCPGSAESGDSIHAARRSRAGAEIVKAVLAAALFVSSFSSTSDAVSTITTQ